MRKNYLLAVSAFAVVWTTSCKKDEVDRDEPISVTITFEDVALQPQSYLNGSDLSGSFTAGGTVFENSFDTVYSSWSGYACSNVIDDTTGDWTNQFASYAPGGSASSNYAVYYHAGAYGPASFIRFSQAVDLISVQVTNGTYPALSMLNGDGYGYLQPFGGTSGDDPDFFTMVVKGFDSNDNPVDSVTFDLADYRYASSGDDFIIKQWTNVDLSALNGVNYLHLTFVASSPMVPAYVCLDNLKYAF